MKNNPETFLYRGAIENLNKIGFESPLVFTGKNSFEKIKPHVEKYLKNPFYYNNFSTNPKIEEVNEAINLIDFNFDIIIAIGGGSVIDFAKIFKYKKAKSKKLIAIPTTCGTGSEATQFAVYYENKIKHSLDEKEILPDFAIIDSQFVENNPHYLKCSTALDAYCQAIESYFACNSTIESRQYAKKAIKLCKDNIVEYINSPNEKNSYNMCLASNLAGKAINISRTTLAHAMSYSITTNYDIPHGHAVALNIAKLMEYNKNVDENSINDKRGVDFVKARMDEIYSLIGIINALDYFSDLFEKINLENKTFEVSYIDPQRAKNNPRKFILEEYKKIK